MLPLLGIPLTNMFFQRKDQLQEKKKIKSMCIFFIIEEYFERYEERRKHCASNSEFCGNECHINFKILLFCSKMTTLIIKQT